MSILLKPIITEKMTNESELRNKYAFKVQREANKIEIKDAVEDAYGVTVESVNTH
jgi:large subunit ribosomal protein L23